MTRDPLSRRAHSIHARTSSPGLERVKRVSSRSAHARSTPVSSGTGLDRVSDHRRPGSRHASRKSPPGSSHSRKFLPPPSKYDFVGNYLGGDSTHKSRNTSQPSTAPSTPTSGSPALQPKSPRATRRRRVVVSSQSVLTDDGVSFKLKLPGFKGGELQTVLRRDNVLVLTGQRHNHATGDILMVKENFALNASKVHVDSLNVGYDETQETMKISVRRKKRPRKTKLDTDRKIPIRVIRPSPKPSPLTTPTTTPKPTSSKKMSPKKQQEVQAAIDEYITMMASLSNIDLGDGKKNNDDEHEMASSTTKIVPGPPLSGLEPWARPGTEMPIRRE